MKSIRLITVVLILGLGALSCQVTGLGSEQTTEIPAATEAPAAQETSYPQPGEVNTAYPEAGAYPPAAVEMTITLYPDLGDGAEITWEQAMGLIGTGQVTQVMQSHDLKVYLTLKDGRTLVSVEPVIDDIIRLIQECGDFCKDIKIATE